MGKNSIKQTKSEIILNLEVAVFEEHGIWVAYCPALELSSYGDSQDEAEEAFKEALGIFIHETMERGTLERFLLSMGWSLTLVPKPEYAPPSNHRKESLQRHKPIFFNETVAIPSFA